MLSPEQLAIANEAIDMQELTPSPSYTRDSAALRGKGLGGKFSTHLDSGGDLMGLPQPHCQPFRDM